MIISIHSNDLVGYGCNLLLNQKFTQIDKVKDFRFNYYNLDSIINKINEINSIDKIKCIFILNIDIHNFIDKINELSNLYKVIVIDYNRYKFAFKDDNKFNFTLIDKNQSCIRTCYEFFKLNTINSEQLKSINLILTEIEKFDNLELNSLGYYMNLYYWEHFNNQDLDTHLLPVLNPEFENICKQIELNHIKFLKENQESIKLRDNFAFILLDNCFMPLIKSLKQKYKIVVTTYGKVYFYTNIDNKFERASFRLRLKYFKEKLQLNALFLSNFNSKSNIIEHNYNSSEEVNKFLVELCKSITE
jgi:hypothetical protein